MSMNFQLKVIHYVIGDINDRIEKRYQKIEGKYIWETIDVIPLFPLVGLNHHQTILHMSRIMVYIYTTDEQINQFPIGCMINPSLQINNLFREQV